MAPKHHYNSNMTTCPKFDSEKAFCLCRNLFFLCMEFASAVLRDSWLTLSDKGVFFVIHSNRISSPHILWTPFRYVITCKNLLFSQQVKTLLSIWPWRAKSSWEGCDDIVPHHHHQKRKKPKQESLEAGSRWISPCD